jgi:Uma2 family endonuclease
MAAPTEKRALLTAEDLYEYHDRRHRYELVRGELRVSEPRGWEHGTIAIQIGALLHQFVRAHGLGYVSGEAGYVLERGPDTVRGPDVAFIRWDRRPGPDVEHRYFEGAPDLTVEIVSPSNRASQVAEKVADYLTKGTRAIWVIHPMKRQVVVYTPDGAARTLGESDRLDGGDVVPGFSCTVAELFPERPSIH